MPRLPSWAVSEAFWKRVKPLLPQPTRDPIQTLYPEKGGCRKPLDYRKIFDGIIMFSALATNGRQPFKLYGEMGYDLKPARFILTPAATQSYTRIRVGSFTDTGANVHNLKVSFQTGDSLQTGAGGRLTISFSTA